MKNFLQFLKDYKQEISFGWGLTFLSSFGQTFLISLYVPEILKTFELSKGSFGSIYAICTVISSVIMLTVGHTVDHKPVKKVTAFTVLGLASSCFVLGFSHHHIALLFIAFTGMRLCGQGLLSHISFTVMSKYFSADRGKALSISSLGYSVGEALFPLAISTLILWYDYELAAMASGFFLLFYLIRLKFVKLKHFDANLDINKKASAGLLLGQFKEVISDKRFFIMMPASFSTGFISTAIFFYQYVFVEEKGWSLTLYASFFTAYAITRFVLSIAGGFWVDKYTAKRLFRIYLIPMCFGLLALAFIDSIVGALIFLILSGITVGVAGTVKTAVIAEIYGTKQMGTIRSLFTMFMVLSTALGPLIVGWMLDKDIPFSWVIFSLFLLMAIAQLNAQRIRKY
ncbi:MFS transporter [Galbibacter sp. BG1]|uniref:MFS transporter n=1 Tax=Galbibacter sp. BG1 TaxID=1170699 RepID=UPI0015B951D2|nr:MFS transporter [Galbibacter sp. BG1]QLE01419.1 MFS transporter [Galbibacter sp. BG1]